MYKAIIIEDEFHAAQLLENMLLDVAPMLAVVDKCDNLQSGVQSIRKYHPDVVFLDIELPVYSGIQLLEFFDNEEIDFHIVFTTAFNDYAIRAFEMSAIDYLLKPLQPNKLQSAISKLEKIGLKCQKDQLPILRQNLMYDDKKMVIPVHNGFEVINIRDICYFKAEGSYTHIELENGSKLLVSKNLKHFQHLLEDNASFFRMHRSAMVNVKFIKRIVRDAGYSAVLTNGRELPISDEKISNLLTLIQQL